MLWFIRLCFAASVVGNFFLVVMICNISVSVQYVGVYYCCIHTVYTYINVWQKKIADVLCYYVKQSRDSAS